MIVLRLYDYFDVIFRFFLAFASALATVFTICLRMQHFGQNKEVGVPPVNLFRSCHESRNVAYSKKFGVNDKNLHGSIGKMSINV